MQISCIQYTHELLDYLLLSEGKKDIKRITLGPHKTVRGLWVLTPGLGTTNLRTVAPNLWVTTRDLRVVP